MEKITTQNPSKRENVRQIYIVIYVIYTSLNKFIPIFPLPSWFGTIYSVLAIAGGILLAIDFFTDRNMFRIQHSGILVLFLIVMAVSSVVNIRYGFVSNFKTLAWSAIQMLLLGAVAQNTSREKLLKSFRIAAECFIAIWFVGVLISFFLYLIQYGNVVATSEDPRCPIGFLEGRLFGVFTDPNVGATCSLLSIVLAWFFMVWDKKLKAVRKCYYILTIVFNGIYVVLSGSRMGLLIVAVSSAFAVLLYAREKLRRYAWKRAMRSIAAIAIAIVCSAAILLGLTLAKRILAYLPACTKAVIVTTQEETDSMVLPEIGEMQVDFTREDVEENADISNSRFKIWRDCLKLFERSPLLGTSPRNHLAFAEDHFGEMYIVRKQYSVHNGYLAVLTCTGILGAAVVLVWIFLVLKTVLSYLFRKNAADPYYLPIAFSTVALLIIAISAFFMMGIFFGNSIIEVLFWVILGNSLYMIRLAEPEKYPKEPVLYRWTETVQKKLTKHSRAKGDK